MRLMSKIVDDNNITNNMPWVMDGLDDMYVNDDEYVHKSLRNANKEDEN